MADGKLCSKFGSNRIRDHRDTKVQVVPVGWQTLHTESAKCRKYSSLIPSFHFSPLCVETLGAWGSCVCSLVRQIGSWVMEQSGDNRATQFLIQKVAIEVQHGNAASVMATIPSSQDWAEFSSLPTD